MSRAGFLLRRRRGAKEKQMDPTSRSLGPPVAGHRHVGHAHFWERALSRGQFLYDTAAISWSGQSDNFSIVSDPASTSVSQFAAIGHERNGRFFPQGN
jgi:hypothetical protein